jgi:hypothetical protein
MFDGSILVRLQHIVLSDDLVLLIIEVLDSSIIQQGVHSNCRSAVISGVSLLPELSAPVMVKAVYATIVVAVIMANCVRPRHS